MPADARRELGARGETLAATWYSEHGYRVLDRNWRSRSGEIDLILEKERLVVFCEVKTRRSSAFGAPIEALTATKVRRLRALAAAWLAEHGSGGGSIRFDVASVLVPYDARATVEIVEGAF